MADPLRQAGAAAHRSCDEAVLAALLVLPLSCIAIANLGWLIGGHLQAVAALALSLIASIVVLLRWPDADGRSLRLWLAVMGAALLAAWLLHDLSTDGTRYHQQAVITLAGDFDPFRSEPVGGQYGIWINGYPKGAWTWAAVWWRATGLIELGKSLNLLLLLASWLSARDLLHRKLHLPARWAAVAAVALAASPVAATQWPTFLSDGALGSLILVFATRAIALGLAPLDQAGRQVVLCSMALVLMSLIKTSGLVYAGLLVALSAGLLVLARGWRPAARWTAVQTLVLGLGVATLGFNPYVTNWMRHGHPFYPLAGAGKVDIITSMAPKGILDHGPIWQLLGSAFSISHNEFEGADRPAAIQPKWPGTVQRSELETFSKRNDTRIGGFGPWFSLALCFSAVAVCFLARSAAGGHRTARWGLLLGASVLGLVLAFPQPWWARYVPQLWLLPGLLAVGLYRTPVSPVASRLLAAALLLVQLANAGMVFGAFAIGSALREIEYRAHLENLRDISMHTGTLVVRLDKTPSTAVVLDARGVRWRVRTDNEACADWQPIRGTGAMFCLDASARPLLLPQAPLISAAKARLAAWRHE